jgi:outer membrane protein
MTAWKLRRLSLLTMSIMLSGIVERRGFAQIELTRETAPVAESELPEPYWVPAVQSLCAGEHPNVMPLDFDQAIWDALAYSPYVKAVLTAPQISIAKVSEANGQFDPAAIVDSLWNDTSDPVGSTLTTGGPLRLNEYRLDNGVGIKAKNQLGGSTELTQNMQLRNNNSVFLSPKEQADAKMLLRLNQPLMRGAGRTYATSSVRIAHFNAGVSQHEATRKLQFHAQSIASAYWTLYSARAVEMQAYRGRERLTYLRDELAKRADVDGLQSQLLRAEAALAKQTSNMARARADAAAAQATLRALVNAPDMATCAAGLIPVTRPVDQPFCIDGQSELETALACHPDLLAARDRIKAAVARLNVAKNELKPTLNLVMEGYLHGLNGDYGLGDSLTDQFSQGRPSYAGGVNYQRPYRNMISKAIMRERRLELRQLLLELDNTMLTVTAEVDQAIAAVGATFKELESAVISTVAFHAEVEYLSGRWRNAFIEPTQPSLLLDELLNAQNQLIQSENAWARAQGEHMIAFAKLHVATGMLLNAVHIPIEP